jgi:RNA polymerase sigma-70 factor (ECF subfamily)
MRFASPWASPGRERSSSGDAPPVASRAPDAEKYVSAALEGDKGALENLLTLIRPLVWRYCRARMGASARASVSSEDVAQDVCLAVVYALPRYEDCGRPFLAFVYGIARNKVADARRAAARNREDAVESVPDGASAPGAEATILADELGARVSELLSVLPEKQREILVLRVVVGLSAEATAEATGSTAGAVRVAQHRALAKLRSTALADDPASACR